MEKKHSRNLKFGGKTITLNESISKKCPIALPLAALLPDIHGIFRQGCSMAVAREAVA
jgi:hypothetical protein